ncbi:hypothetical protein BOX15_Mlig029265g3 [Macrostomum lignano]|uniref:Uncharacterized protein n=1 Tax=Macrostomum lignano TaxID=282301 RepID=A0A267E7E1_9PLAT|nr:hypothetical protein BOX15_Mlig029265g3 [Macrostomum lignano]
MTNIKEFGSNAMQFLRSAARAVRSACQLKRPQQLTETSNSNSAFSRALQCRTARRSGTNRGKSGSRSTCNKGTECTTIHQSSNSDLMLNYQSPQRQVELSPKSNSSMDDPALLMRESDSFSLESGAGFECDQIQDVWTGHSPMRVQSPAVLSDTVSIESGAELELCGAVADVKSLELPAAPLSSGVEFETNLQDEDEELDTVPVLIAAGQSDVPDSNKSEASDLPPDLLSDLSDTDQDVLASRSQTSPGGELDSCDVSTPVTVMSASSAASVPQSGSNVDSSVQTQAAGSRSAQPENLEPRRQSNWMSSRFRRVKRGLIKSFRRLRHGVDPQEQSRRDNPSETAEAHEVRIALDDKTNDNNKYCR